MEGGGLFPDLPTPSAEQQEQAEASRRVMRELGSPRVRQPNRLQIEFRASDLESLLPEDHRARLVWGYVVLQDLSSLSRHSRNQTGHTMPGEHVAR